MFQRYEGEAWEKRFLPRLTSREIAEMEKEDALVILPVGAVEQHGAHLPVMTDSLIGEAILTRTLEKIDPEEQIWLLPPLSYGKSNEHIGMAGTISLSVSTLLAVVSDIAASLKASRFRRLLLFNTHGGNADLLNVIAREVRIANGLMVFCLSPGSLNVASDLVDDEELELGIHGGDFETSLVMAIKPGWVKRGLLVREVPCMHRFEFLSLEGSIRFAWKMADISASGIAGDATKASADKGEIILERISDVLSRVLVEMRRFEIGDLLQPSSPRGSDA